MPTEVTMWGLNSLSGPCMTPPFLGQWPPFTIMEMRDEPPIFHASRERNTDMKLRFMSAASLLLIWFLTLPAWAAEYRLEVADLDYQTYSAYQEHLANLEQRVKG
jgi:hypothetical protein